MKKYLTLAATISIILSLWFIFHKISQAIRTEEELKTAKVNNAIQKETIKQTEKIIKTKNVQQKIVNKTPSSPSNYRINFLQLVWEEQR